MKARNGVFLCGLFAFAMAAATPGAAHDTPDFDHSHAFQQSRSGVWRQGHYVNGNQGSIIIWSPRMHDGYQKAPPVRFARPQPITRAPAGAAVKRRASPASSTGRGVGTWPNPPR